MSKLMSKDGKLFGKINLLDFVVLLIVAVMLLGILFRFVFVGKDAFVPDYQEGYITIVFPELTKVEMNAIKQGDKISVDKIQYLGVIEDEPIVENMLVIENSIDGKGYAVGDPLRFDVTVKVKSDKLYEQDGVCFIDKGYKLVDGMSLDMTNGILPTRGTVLDVEFTK